MPFSSSPPPPPPLPRRSPIYLYTRLPLALTLGVGGTLGSSGAIATVKSAAKSVGGTLGSSGAIVKADSKALGGSITPAGALVKVTTKPLAGALAPTGAAVTALTHGKSVAGTLTSSGAIVKADSKPLGGTLATAGAITKATAKPLGGTLTSSGAIRRALAKPLAGALTSAGTLVKNTSKALGGVLLAGGSLLAEALYASLATWIDVRNAAGTRVGEGPAYPIGTRYGYYVDRIGAAIVNINGHDRICSVVTERGQVWIYKGNEGLVFRGRIVGVETTVNEDGAAVEVLSLASLSEDLAAANTGLGLSFSAVAPSALLGSNSTAATLLYATGWSAGALDTPVYAISPRYDAKSIWQAAIDAAVAYNIHVREDAITLSAGVPVKKVDMGSFGDDCGLTFLGGQALSPRISENSDMIPIRTIRRGGDAKELYTRVIALGPGTGYPTITLLAATQGKNLCTNPSAEGAGTTATDWSAPFGTLTQQSVGFPAKSGSKFFQLVWSSGTVLIGLHSTVISGATLNRKYKVGAWFYGAGTTIGKPGIINVQTTGGSSPASAFHFPTIVAGYQYWEEEVTCADNNSTGVSMYIGIEVGFAGAGDVCVWDRVTFWESTYFPYCVEHELSQGGVDEYFIEDVAATILLGQRRDKYLNVKNMVPLVATKAAYIASVNTMYGIAVRYLTLHKQALVTYQITTVGTRHVAAGVQRFKVGQKARLWYHGITQEPEDASPRAFLTVDASVWIMGYDRTLNEDGTDTYVWQLAVTDLYQQSQEALFAKLFSDFRDAENTLALHNFVFTASFGPVACDTLTVIVADITAAMHKLLAIQSMVITWRQVSGGSTSILSGVQAIDGYGFAITTRTPVVGTYYVDDGTAGLQQAPTPVPVPSTSLQAILARASGAHDAVVDGTITIEGTKLPLTPS